MNAIPLSLYIHTPWCVRKCPYCDFNSHTAPEGLPEDAYLAALLDDLEQDLTMAATRPIASVFIGGGTPSLLSPGFYQKLFRGISERIDIRADAEITLEANPGTAEAGRFEGYRAAGINRLSMGIQSFNPEHLQRLGRIHDCDQALKAIEMATVAGFENFNLDLMHGLPGQTLEQAMFDLNTALSFNPAHLSWYQLTIEPNTEFYKRPPELPQDETLWDIQEAGQALLATNGYRHYEISAFARAGRESRHNLNYWRFGDYLGIGAGAHGKLTHADGVIERRWKTRLPKDYLTASKPYLAGREVIESHQVGLECLMNALRLHDGISVELFQQRTGLDLQSVQGPLNKAIDMGLLEQGDQIKATERGRLYLNELLAQFLTDD
ncbi:MAG: YggW family oxidoreductase [Oceanospirillaceae bacterium]|nr:YggW family oxidoreductase [Oceanospirillaceae bacterium]